MFLTMAIVFLVLWVLGAFVFRIIGGVVHLLLTIALIALVLHFVRGQNAADSGPTALPAADPQTERFRTMSRPSNGCEYGRISVRCDLLGTGSPGLYCSAMPVRVSARATSLPQRLIPNQIRRVG